MSSGSGKEKNILVIGAGMVGVACALKLQRSGHWVTLVDKDLPGEGTSFGPAGIVGCSSLVPVPVPGVYKKLPKMWLDPMGPLSINIPFALKNIPWFLAYLKASKRETVVNIGSNLGNLIRDAKEQHHALAAGSRAESYLQDAEYTFAYLDETACRGDSFGWNLRKQNGVDFKEIGEDTLRQRIPDLGPKFTYGVTFETKHGFISNPGDYVKALAEAFVAEGGTLLQKKIQQINLEGENPEAVADSWRLSADRIVVSSGAWSNQLLAPAGYSFPLLAERGYHLMLKNHNLKLSGPVMSTTGKCIVTPMEEGLRVAGLVEFADIDEKHNTAFADTLLQHAKDLFPNLTYESVTQWHGNRPALPDSLPAIGPLPKQPKVLVAFGHQHIGMMSAPKTAEMIRDLINEVPTSIPLDPFSPGRFF